MLDNGLISLLPYQVTSLLLQARKDTGLTFDLDSNLQGGEFTVLPITANLCENIDIEGVRLSTETPFETICSFVSMLDIEKSRVLSFLASIPLVGRLTWIILCNRNARRYADLIGLEGTVVFWG